MLKKKEMYLSKYSRSIERQAIKLNILLQHIKNNDELKNVQNKLSLAIFEITHIAQNIGELESDPAYFDYLNSLTAEQQLKESEKK